MTMEGVLELFLLDASALRPGCTIGTNDAVLSYVASLAAYPGFASV
eukprot:CAMPEP_0175620846 /NCGR_PEP_ID=MMETSP0096-20121207/68127_1 /TAXON_ID=311494 /ORGANISM="Alexandrium monilatum, Strain CCMP3105" /LENGTH=45 /DNA_ID= /DNA_START= /DNA_END= /DNA_ORIENTATION=